MCDKCLLRRGLRPLSPFLECVPTREEVLGDNFGRKVGQGRKKDCYPKHSNFQQTCLIRVTGCWMQNPPCIHFPRKRNIAAPSPDLPLKWKYPKVATKVSVNLIMSGIKIHCLNSPLESSRRSGWPVKFHFFNRHSL